jgi:hypothetical protein
MSEQSGSESTEFSPSPATLVVLEWAHEAGATTIEEAAGLFEAAPEMEDRLGLDGSQQEGVREDLETATELLGPDAQIAELL